MSQAGPQGWLKHRLWWNRLRLVDWILPGHTADLAPSPLEPRHVEGCRVMPDRDVMIRDHLPKHGVVAEVGVSSGSNAKTILEGAEPTELHLIDIDFSLLRRELLEPSLSDGTVQLHEGDSVAALQTFREDFFDWIYIDGDHSYPGVVRDIEQATRAVKPDGVLVFNDYILFSHLDLTALGVVEPGRELAIATRYGVVDAVNELCVKDGWVFRYLALHPQMHCDVAVARMAA